MDQYLSASGYLPSGVRPFFIALPKASLAGLLEMHDIHDMLLVQLPLTRYDQIAGQEPG